MRQFLLLGVVSGLLALQAGGVLVAHTHFGFDGGGHAHAFESHDGHSHFGHADDPVEVDADHAQPLDATPPVEVFLGGLGVAVVALGAASVAAWVAGRGPRPLDRSPPGGGRALLALLTVLRL